MKHLFKKHLKDNSGEENMTKMIIIAMFFVLGAILIAAVTAAIVNYYGNGTNSVIHDVMN